MADSPVISVLLLGDPEVGKSTFLQKAYRLGFYDTASPEPWSLLQPDVVVLCYDISQRLSLINLKRVWHKATFTHHSRPTSTPLLILGLKRDLRSETDPNGIIYPQEGHRFAQEMRSDKYMECSAFTGELVREVFEDICQTAAATTMESGGVSEGGCVVM